MRNRNRIEKRTIADKIEGTSALSAGAWRAVGLQAPLSWAQAREASRSGLDCAGWRLHSTLCWRRYSGLPVRGQESRHEKGGFALFQSADCHRGSSMWYRTTLVPQRTAPTAIGCDLHDARARVSSEQLPLNVLPMPPINAATLSPGCNSPPGARTTSPAHSIPLTSAASAHYAWAPRRASRRTP
jgi:hypothetical protein